jgi:hypothetical protein
LRQANRISQGAKSRVFTAKPGTLMPALGTSNSHNAARRRRRSRRAELRECIPTRLAFFPLSPGRKRAGDNSIPAERFGAAERRLPFEDAVGSRLHQRLDIDVPIRPRSLCFATCMHLTVARIPRPHLKPSGFEPHQDQRSRRGPKAS